MFLSKDKISRLVDQHCQPTETETIGERVAAVIDSIFSTYYGIHSMFASEYRKEQIRRDCSHLSTTSHSDAVPNGEEISFCRCDICGKDL